jgi:peptidylprolyl isomerase
MRRNAGAIALALLITALPAAAQTPDMPPAPKGSVVVARLGEIALTDAQLRALLAELPADRLVSLRRDVGAMTAFVRSRMVGLGLAAEADANRFDQRPDVRRRLEQARTEALAEAYLDSLWQGDPSFPTEAELQAVYDANRSQFMIPRRYRLAQIFLSVPPGASGDDAARRLRDYRERLVAPRGRTDFADLARRYSDDRRSAQRGGEQDWAREDQLIPPIREAARGLEEGAVSEPIRGPDGWHLIRLLETRPAGPAPLSEMRGELTALMRQQRAAELRRQALNDFLGRTPVMIDEIELGKILLDRTTLR